MVENQMLFEEVIVSVDVKGVKKSFPVVEIS